MHFYTTNHPVEKRNKKKKREQEREKKREKKREMKRGEQRRRRNKYSNNIIHISLQIYCKIAAYCNLVGMYECCV